MSTTIPATAAGDLLIRLPNPSPSADGQPFRLSVEATRRPLARVRVLGAPRLPIPRSLPAGRYYVSVRGGLMAGRTLARIKLRSTE